MDSGTRLKTNDGKLFPGAPINGASIRREIIGLASLLRAQLKVSMCGGGALMHMAWVTSTFVNAPFKMNGIHNLT